MSFVEGITSVSLDVAESGFVVCVSGIALLVGLLLTVPTLATTLRLLGREHALGKFLARLLSLLDRSRR